MGLLGDIGGAIGGAIGGGGSDNDSGSDSGGGGDSGGGSTGGSSSGGGSAGGGSSGGSSSGGSTSGGSSSSDSGGGGSPDYGISDSTDTGSLGQPGSVSQPADTGDGGGLSNPFDSPDPFDGGDDGFSGGSDGGGSTGSDGSDPGGSGGDDDFSAGSDSGSSGFGVVGGQDLPDPDQTADAESPLESADQATMPDPETDFEAVQEEAVAAATEARAADALNVSDKDAVVIQEDEAAVEGELQAERIREEVAEQRDVPESRVNVDVGDPFETDDVQVSVQGRSAPDFDYLPDPVGEPLAGAAETLETRRVGAKETAAAGVDAAADTVASAGTRLPGSDAIGDALGVADEAAERGAEFDRGGPESLDLPDINTSDIDLSPGSGNYTSGVVPVGAARGRAVTAADDVVRAATDTRVLAGGAAAAGGGAAQASAFENEPEVDVPDTSGFVTELDVPAEPGQSDELQPTDPMVDDEVAIDPETRGGFGDELEPAPETDASGRTIQTSPIATGLDQRPMQEEEDPRTITEEDLVNPEELRREREQAFREQFERFQEDVREDREYVDPERSGMRELPIDEDLQVLSQFDESPDAVQREGSDIAADTAARAGSGPMSDMAVAPMTDTQQDLELDIQPDMATELDLGFEQETPLEPQTPTLNPTETLETPAGYPTETSIGVEFERLRLPDISMQDDPGDPDDPSGVGLDKSRWQYDIPDPL